MLAMAVVSVPSAAETSRSCLDATAVTALHRVGNRPIICHVLDALLDAGVPRTTVLAPQELTDEVAAAIRACGPTSANVQYLPQAGGPARALPAIAELAGEAPVIFHRADGLLGQPIAGFLDLLGREGADAVLLVAQGARNAEPLGPAAQRALRVAELDPVGAALELAGACILGPSALARLCEADPPPATLQLTALAESLLASDTSRPQVRMVRAWRAFAGDPHDLLDLNRMVLQALDSHAPPMQREGNRFEGAVLIDPSASVSSSVISGPVVIGAGARIADSYVGPNTSIGEKAHLEGVEIERSIVFAQASLLHVGARLVASVVGRDARIFRDFSVPRAMRMQIGDGAMVALC